MEYRKEKAGFQELLVIFIIIWSIAPPLQVGTMYRLLALGCAGLWMLISLRKGLYLNQKQIYGIFLTIGVIAVTLIEKVSLDALLQQIAIYMLVISLIINGYYQDRWEKLQWMFPLILALLAYFNWKSGNALLVDHTLARKLVRVDDEMIVYLKQGIGGYSLIYPQVCIFSTVVLWTIKAFRKSFVYSVLGIVWISTYVFYIWNAGYSLALFVSIASLIVLVVLKEKSVVPAMIIAIAAFVIGLYMIVEVEAFREYLLTQFDGTAIAKKINDLVATSEEGVAEGSIADRILTYQYSLERIMQYPFVGSLWRDAGGGHSAILDMFAKYGIAGGLVYGSMILHVPMYYKKRYHNRTIYRMANANLVALLFLGMLDSFSYSFMCMILLVLPMIYEYIIKWERITE